MSSALLSHALLLLPVLLRAQSAVEGVVLRAATTDPVAGATVKLMGDGSAPSTLTDANGRFRFDGVNTGGYIAEASAEGYSPPRRTAYSRQFVRVVKDQPPAPVELRLRPLVSISGSVFDEEHQPIAGVRVNAIRATSAGGERAYQVVGEATTNSAGQFRFAGIEPGLYLLSTAGHDDFAPALFPGVDRISETNAQQVRPGTEWTANIKLRKSQRYAIRGRVLPSPRNGGLQLQSLHQCNAEAPPGLDTIPVREDADGGFTISGLYRGTYCFTAIQGRDLLPLSPAVTISDGDLDNVELAPEATFTMHGSVTAGETRQAAFPQFPISLRTRDGAVFSTRVAPDGTFRFEGVRPESYQIALPGGLPTYARSMMYGAQDVTNGIIPVAAPGVPLHIILGTDTGQLTVSVEAREKENAPLMLVIAPADAFAARDDLLRILAVNTGGHATVSALPPGDYRVFALTTGETEDSRNRDLLRHLEDRSRAVTMHPGGRESVTVAPISAFDIEDAKERLR